MLCVGWKSSSWMLVNSIPWRKMNRSEALASGTEQGAWAACDQMERIDSRDVRHVRNRCRVVVLNRELGRKISADQALKRSILEYLLMKK